MSEPHEYSGVPIERLLPAWRAQVAKLSLEANELHAENARLRSVAEDNKRECEATRIENARLKAEVERLTKAGDAMGEEMLKLNHPHASIYLWCKAKEGNQP